MEFDARLHSAKAFHAHFPERKGPVEKKADATDARGVAVTLSVKGKKTFPRAAVIAKARNNDILASLSRSEREVRGKILAKLIAAHGDG